MFGDLFEEDGDRFSSHTIGGNSVKGKDTEPPPPRANVKLSGIKNQGGTCYLNSLLQTLLFTPEFREELFNLGPEELGNLMDKDKPEAKQVRVIPLELQRLFARLLLLEEQTASTTALTDSFGWTNHEEMSQQDVQELNRILFSALESSLEGTSGSSLIQRLYHGTLVNHIICKECNNVSERQEDFLDLTVCVRGVSGLEEVLWHMFVEEELFEGNNLYWCSHCDGLVHAAKSTKLRKLPPFLTVSLLRFSYDFGKCERFKEMSRYTFPLTINLRPFCEQSELPDSEFSYELFSVIIHKGSCYGGHYHVYIKDIDQLGHWEAPEDDVKEKHKAQKKLPKVQECEDTLDWEDPLAVVTTVLAQEASGSVLVDQLGQKIMDKIGSSWNKKFRKQYGPISKFLQSHTDVFMLVSNGSCVALKATTTSEPVAPSLHSNRLEHAEAELQGSAELDAEPASGSCWFDLNDSAVTPIREQAISKQFEGRESAYMLFYRKSTLQRPPQAKGNPAYKVPLHLLEMIQEENATLQQRRADFDASSNRIEVRLHLAPHYHVQNGALQPSSTNTRAVVSMMFDRRKTVGDLRLAVYQMQTTWEGDMALTLAKNLPAGLHLYDTLDDDEKSLYSAGLCNGSDLFVWNGKEVNGVQVQTGAEWEPVLLTILRPGEDELDSGSAPGVGATRTDGSGIVRFTQGFASGITLGGVREVLGPQEALVCQEAKGAQPGGGGASGWRLCPPEAMRQTLRELTLRDGDSLLLLPSTQLTNSMFSLSGDMVTVMTPLDCRWLQVEYWSQTASEEEEGGRQECKKRKIPASGDTRLGEVKQRALEELQLQECFRDEPCCLRQMDRTGKLLPPVCDHLSVRDAGIRLMTSLCLCHGCAPKASQLFLYFRVGVVPSAGQDREIIVEERLSVKECLTKMLQLADLDGMCWHLRRMDWCEEVGEPLMDENASLLDVKLCSGDTLVIAEGQLPPKGFLKLSVRWLVDRSSDCVSSFPDLSHKIEWAEMEMTSVGYVEISQEASLHDLRCQVLTLPALVGLCMPTPEFLRLWVMEGQTPSRILRGNQQTLRKLKLGMGSEVCVQKLLCEEDLGLKEVLLRLKMGVPGERAYYSAQEFVWDAGRDPSPKGLYNSLASLYSTSPDNLLLAKHLPDKHTWMAIHNWTQHVSKKKKKKKVESLQGTPYCLRDGDIIGVKNLLVDSNREFSTLKDEQEQQRLREQTDIHKKGGQTASGEITQEARPEGKARANKNRKPEVALSINVAVFR
ncbi:ubiquitin carboxyl-terminal hydrolase 40 [Electrophorus electricus]|uniref:ubiquitin carboxyl-terminal hydrolase 40 n=1 Tax=Electrophorus electricus TaxID=8005 RepID=UPI0015CFD426|nr:ubiquitin carboxyl-terminal hydrolase 40 [Electrophorus electricus]